MSFSAGVLRKDGLEYILMKNTFTGIAQKTFTEGRQEKAFLI